MLDCSSSAPGAEDHRVVAAAAVLARGGTVVYPTETVYGLGVDATNPAALHRLAMLKGREARKPIAVLISDTGMLRDVVDDIPALAEVLMRRFWPGPLTIVLRARAGVSPLLTGGGTGIGVRLSSHPVATALVRVFGRAVTTPSANPAGQRPPTRLVAAREYFGEQVEAYVDGGMLRGEPASTVVDARGALRVIRAGAVAVRDLQEAVTTW